VAEALLNHSGPSIRYKDIVDYVSDTFETESVQTPFYVIQADLTEIFCTVTDPLRTTLAQIISVDGGSPASPEGDEPQSLVELIKVDAQRYCSEEEAFAKLAFLRAG
jgi:hypothetical protein